VCARKNMSLKYREVHPIELYKAHRTALSIYIYIYIYYTGPFEGPYRDLQGPSKGPIYIVTGPFEGTYRHLHVFRRALSRFTGPFEGPYRDLQGPLKGPIEIYTALTTGAASPPHTRKVSFGFYRVWLFLSSFSYCRTFATVK